MKNPRTSSEAAVDDVRKSGAYRAPTLAEVSLDRLRRNADVFRAVCRAPRQDSGAGAMRQDPPASPARQDSVAGAARKDPPAGPARPVAADADVLAVVKADAYGHGATPAARTLEEHGIRWFGVATPAEGITLRRAGIEGRIVVFAAPLPEHLGVYPPYDLEATVSSLDVAEAIIARGDPFKVHVKVDTGMGRIGISPDEAPRAVSLLERAAHVQIAGLWTHLATADEPDPGFAREQLDRFAGVVTEVGEAAERIHVANTAAALRLPESLDYERALARIGLGLYGCTSPAGLASERGLEAVMTVSSTVTHVKTVEPGTSVSYGRRWTADRRTRIATVGAGYADGYHRLLSNRARVGIRGRRYPVVGTVCMDMFMVDLGPDSDVTVGDPVVLFGDGGPSASDLAAWAETIPYEVLTSVSARVPRAYVDAPQNS